MSAAPRLRLLHLSDLHIGKETTSPWRLRRVMGQAWANNLLAIAADCDRDGHPIDLICFTGDLAQSGQAHEYAEASAFVDELLAVLKLPKSRFFCVPGNHDVDRTVHPGHLSGARAASTRAPVPAEMLARGEFYRAWLNEQGLTHLLAPAGKLGYRVSLTHGGVPLHLIGLDSAWLAGDAHDAGRLRVTDEQVGRLLTDGKGHPLPGHKLALIHHPLGDLADGTQVEGLLTEWGVGLLMHGHVHASKLSRLTTFGFGTLGGLTVATAGCLYQDDRYRNSLQILDLELSPGQVMRPTQVWTRSWSANGYWYNDTEAHGGKGYDGRVSLLSTPLQAVLPLGGTLEGRAFELRQIRDALLPTPGVGTCILVGMPGVGKTRLAEEFAHQHWLPTRNPSTDIADTADADDTSDAALVHHALEANFGQTPSDTALSLAQKLADHLKCYGDPVTLYPRLAQALTHGPHGQPRLLWIDNVDTEGAAKAVGELVNRLRSQPGGQPHPPHQPHPPRFAILITARYTGLRLNDATTVPVNPLSDAPACALLRAKVATIDPAVAQTLSDATL